jgi:hypothetical protein
LVAHNQSIYPSTYYIPTYLFIYLSIHLLQTYVSIYLSITYYIPTYLSIYLSINQSINGSTVRLLDFGRFFSSLILHTVGRILWTGDQQSQGLYPHTEQRTGNKRTQTSMPKVGFEPIIPAFDRANTVHALDRAATVIGRLHTRHIKYNNEK